MCLTGKPFPDTMQILGPTTLAAPLAILKAKCPGGQDLDSPHLYLTGFGAVNRKLYLHNRRATEAHSQVTGGPTAEAYPDNGRSSSTKKERLSH
ncbi:hypothetical protein EYF80_031353 [Liparis tanakae]|uniref:Uncharacterized protein n=1 Tax=Liparis tanakae TaxID=230148 RepID=A0A4Z2H0H9_9TELE|nr:hypothetical protein EYF80_031353 [Liparis tanakae]